MAKFVIAGMQNCPYYVRAEMLGDKLALNLPNFKIHKIVKTCTEWQDWLSEICKANGWEHDYSPIIWRELVDRGGKGVLIGGSNDFEEYAFGYYGVTIDLDSKSMKIITYENLNTKVEIDEEERERKRREKFIKLCITNACNPVCLSLIDSLLSGKIFGQEKISLWLLDCDPEQMDDLQDIAEGIQNMAYGLLHSNVIVTSDCEKAFEGSRVIIFLDEIDKREDEKFYRWLERNATTFGFYGKTLSNVAKSNTMLLVGGNNYICLNMSVLNEAAPHIPSRNIVGISRVIENQAKSVLAEKLPVNSCCIDNVIILGNVTYNYLIELDKTLVRESNCAVVGPPLFSLPLNVIFHQQQWLDKDYTNEVNSRNYANEMYLQHPAYHLAANAISSTLDYWWNGISTKTMFSLTLISEGWYGVPEGIAFSFPVTFYLPLVYSVIEDLNISDKCRQDMDLIINNLIKDRALFVVEDGTLVSKVVSIASTPEEETDYSAFMSSRTPSSQRSYNIDFQLEETEQEEEQEQGKEKTNIAFSLVQDDKHSDEDIENENLQATLNGKDEEEEEEEISENDSNELGDTEYNIQPTKDIEQ